MYIRVIMKHNVQYKNRSNTKKNFMGEIYPSHISADRVSKLKYTLKTVEGIEDSIAYHENIIEHLQYAKKLIKHTEKQKKLGTYVKRGPKTSKSK